MTVTRTLAKFLVEHKAVNLPEAVRHEGARSLLNWVACAVGASKHATVKRALAALYEFSGPRDATILGRSERVDIFQAAMLNGATSHTFDFDDTHLKTVIHPSGPVLSAILALAEHQPVSGRDFLHAFILGVETECRIGLSVFPNHYDAGWHITATAGVFGAAAAAGRLLRLNEQQMVWALGTAATHACGIRETFGTMAKPLHPGIAARNGLLSALLAKKNLTSAEQGIEGRRGFAAILSTKFDPAAITEGLGKTWEISANSYKPYACGVVIHPAIEGCIQLRNEHKLKLEDIERIDLKVHPLVLELTGRRTPKAGLEGKFSVYHSCAAAILLGEGGEAAYSDAIVRNPRVIALRDRVSAVVSEGVREDQMHITMTLKDGRVLEKTIEHVVGSLARPMSDADLEAKFLALCKGILPAAQAGKLIGLCWNVGKLKSAAQIARASVPARTDPHRRAGTVTHDVENADRPEDAAGPVTAVRRLDAEATRSESPCGDGSMVWRSWGDGPALVLLHGGAGSWQHWVRTVPAFSSTHRVLAPDLPGLGESADPPAPPDMATIAAIVAAGIDGLLGPRASYDLVGFSFGASLGGHIALLHAGRVRSLTLLGAGGLVRPRTPMTLERVRDKTGEARMQAHRTNLQRSMIADPARIDALALAIQDWNVQHSRLDTPALITLRPLAVSLPQLRVPVNAIWGERDQIAYYTLEDRIAALRVLRPGIEPHIIPSAGHWAAYESPDAFNATLTGLLRGTPVG